jgi:hypothetical protein
MNNGAELKYVEIRERPKKDAAAKRQPRQGKPYAPPKNHPWRKWQNRNSILNKKVYALAK